MAVALGLASTTQTSSMSSPSRTLSRSPPSATGAALLAFHALNSSSSSLSLNSFLALLARFPSFEYFSDVDPDFDREAGSASSAAFSDASAGSSSSVDESAAPMALRLSVRLPFGLDVASSFL